LFFIFAHEPSSLGASFFISIPTHLVLHSWARVFTQQRGGTPCSGCEEPHASRQLKLQNV
jgi:hypothetical protein